MGIDLDGPISKPTYEYYLYHMGLYDTLDMVKDDVGTAFYKRKADNDRLSLNRFAWGTYEKI